ncbi:MAG: UDP-glucose 4-epimerase GalE [Candidatus Paceibacterota bacterium]|jgi:UDP-glucose 4-epimerase
MQNKKVFVVGGAGYIGSHVVKMLQEKGYSVLVYDNLSKGHKDAVPEKNLVVGELGDAELLTSVMREFNPDAIMHFAGFIEVGQSVKQPLTYYQNNVANTITLLEAATKNNITQFIFSSSAAVYGTPEVSPTSEDAPLRPINPYGQSKVIVEQMLADVARATSLRYVALRYFNAAGADPSGTIGERHDPETHLIPLALKAAKGQLNPLKVFGTNYPTPDGTCIRDYVHVNDIADAHIKALEYLAGGGTSDAFNCGYGHGFSVRQVLDAVKRVTGVNFTEEQGEQRTGDPAMLVADSAKIRRVLGWEPHHDDLDYLVRTAWEWEKSRT